MIGQSYIDQTRAYLDYLEEHFDNIRKAFQELSEACDGMVWVGDDYSWHLLRHEIANHDISKFSMEEFVQYRQKFFPTEHDTDNIEPDFKKAWLHHCSCNEHHWEFIHGLPYEITSSKPGLVERYLIHMIVDWTAMGYKFGDTAQSYYEANAHKIQLTHDQIDFIYILFGKLAAKKLA